MTCIKKIISAASQIWFEKAADIFGRECILYLVIICHVLGIIIDFQRVDVNNFVASACFYAIFHAGIILVTELHVADFSNLNWRVITSAATILPNVIATWVAGNIASRLGGHW